MNVSNQFKETDIDILQELIKSNSLGTWITSKEDELEVNHIPFILDEAQGKYGVLRGHVSIANPVWKSLPTAKQSIVVFQGPQAYITPSWYASKQEHGKVVPTWNYVVVHAHGRPSAIRDEAWLLDHLSALTDYYESTQAQPWKVSDAPENYINKMQKAIVGIEIPIESLVGTWKTSQNKNQPDKAGIIEGLRASDDSESLEMASHVAQHLA